MSCLYISLCVFGALLTLNLFKPPPRPFPFAVLSFIAGLLVGELTVFVLLLQVTGTVLFIAMGAVTGTWAALATALSFISWTGLIITIYQSYHAADDLRSQLDTLFENCMLDSSGANTANSDTHLWRRVRKPFYMRLPGTREIRDVVYKEVDGLQLKLDIYTPRQNADVRGKNSNNAPILFYMHGGGLLENAGTKNGQGLPLLNEMASRGWVAVSVDYRLSPGNRWPAQLLDCKSALLWVKDNIQNYGGNPDFIVTAGDSAGGQLSALMALTANRNELQPDNPERDTRIQGSICFYGVMDFGNLNHCQHNAKIAPLWTNMVLPENLTSEQRLEQLHSASPLSQIHADTPPCLIIHGDCDSLIAVDESRLFASKLSASSSQAVVYAEIPGAQHGFNMLRSLRGEQVLAQVVRFADALHQQYQQKQDSAANAV